MSKPFAFHFKDLDKDAERYIEAHEDCYDEARARDIWAFTVARERTLKAYRAAGADEQICHWLRTEHHYHRGTTRPFEELLDYFRQKGATGKIDQLWRHAAGEMAAEIKFYRLHLGRHTTQKDLDEGKALALDAHRRWRADIEASATPRQLALVDEKIRRIETDETSPVKKKADPRPMDEALFWEIIETTDDIDPVEAMIARLSEHGSGAIKTWYKMLRAEMDRLYRTDLWALAYLILSGCSDDDFEAFRAGLIRMGKTSTARVPDALSELAGELAVSPHVDGSVLFAVADEAHERRTGKPMPTPRRKLPTLTGPDWQEETVNADFPELVAAIAKARG